MWMWVYCLLATIYFIHYKDYLFFIRDTAYRNIIWNTENLTQIDTGAINQYLAENYTLPERVISKVFFIFVSPVVVLYVLFYIVSRLEL